MPSLTIRSRIYGGSGILVALGLAIAGFAVWQLSSIEKTTNRSALFGKQSNRVSEVRYQVEVMRRAAAVYRLDPGQPRITQLKDAAALADKLLIESIDNALSETRKQKYKEIQKDVANITEKFDSLVAINVQNLAAKESLFKGGDELTAAVTSLAQGLRAAAKETLAARIESAVFLVRVANWRFLATNDPKGTTVFRTNVENATTLLQNVEKEDLPITTMRLLDPVRSLLGAYAASFDKVSAGILKMDVLYTSEMRPLNEKTSGAVADVLANLTNDTAMNQADTTSIIELASDVSKWCATLVLLLGGILAFVVGRSIIKPIAGMTGAMSMLATGKTDIEIPSRTAKDEMGSMGRAVEVFRTNAIEVERLKQQQHVAEQEAEARRKADLQKLANDFENAVGEIIDTVSSAATELEASAHTLTTTASRTEELSTMVASSAEEASANVQSVASASEEMSSSVNEISRQVYESAKIAADAVSQANRTNSRVRELSEAAEKIGDVVQLINSIAGQTNLLALNATIEAARAGEAGRGFAVVAAEVKSLAEQTAKATGEIGEQIKGIQGATADSVEAIREIGLTIGRISEISSTIASAVEEQGAATQEIARNVQQASQGTAQVASNISDVQRGSSETGSASTQVLSAAQSLAVESTNLRTEVGRFLSTVRTA